MLNSREVKELRALQLRKNRASSGRFLAEGVRVVEDLLASDLNTFRVVSMSSLEDSPRGAELIRKVDAVGIPRSTVSEREFARLAATDSPQGVLAVAGIPETSIDAIAALPSPAVVLVLDAIQDPGNFGTLVRSAEALGAAAAIALAGTVDPWNPKAVRAAAGSSFRIPIAQVAWDVAARRMRAGGYALLAASAGGEPLQDEVPERAALIVGNEGSGLSESVIRDADRIVSVVTRGRAESLNVGAAAAILLHRLLA